MPTKPCLKDGCDGELVFGGTSHEVAGTTRSSAECPECGTLQWLTSTGQQGIYRRDDPKDRSQPPP